MVGLYFKISVNLTLFQPDKLNSIPLRTAKTLWSFDCSECNRVKRNINVSYYVLMSRSVVCECTGIGCYRQGQSVLHNTFIQAFPVSTWQVLAYEFKYV